MNHFINIKFKNTIDPQKVVEIYKKFGLKKIEGHRQFSYQYDHVELPKSTGLEILSIADSIRNHPDVELADTQFYQHIGYRNINRINPYAPPVLAHVEPDNMIIAVFLSRISDKEKEAEYYKILEELEPTASPFPQDFSNEMLSRPSEEIYYFKKKDHTPFARFNCSILERLRSSEFILAAGPTTTGEDIVQHELLVHFVYQDKEKALTLLEKHQIEITGGNSDYMIAEADLDIGVGIFDLKAILEKSGLFTMIEMNAYFRVWMD